MNFDLKMFSFIASVSYMCIRSLLIETDVLVYVYLLYCYFCLSVRSTLLLFCIVVIPVILVKFSCSNLLCF
jgi:hypothetical protein